MQTENKLNITAGEWNATSSTFGEDIRVNEKTIATCYRKADNEQEAESNALLIADAGTTANKCGLLPSELLKKVDELAAALSQMVTQFGGVSAVTPKQKTSVAYAKEILSSTNFLTLTNHDQTQN